MGSNITSWGFGMAPFKKKTKESYLYALNDVANYIAYKNYSNQICDSISIVKGLFNRVIKQDQWDWFTVYEYFNYPDLDNCRKIVSHLINLRHSILNSDIQSIQKSNYALNFLSIATYYVNFSTFAHSIMRDEEYVYILSRKEEMEILKIGMTTRTVSSRVKEINSSTGILYPISARAVFKVTCCKSAERVSHESLKDYRIRKDREFFSLDFQEAYKILRKCLHDQNLLIE